MAFKFENLRVWRESLQLSNEINLLVKQFPKVETYSLASQIKRAADSVVLNIAEGCTGQSNPEFKRFLNYAMRSGIEVVSCLFIAESRLYIDKYVFKKHYDQYDKLCKMITKLRDSLDKETGIFN